MYCAHSMHCRSNHFSLVYSYEPASLSHLADTLLKPSGCYQSSMHCIPHAHICFVLQIMTEVSVILYFQIPIYCGSPEHRKHGLWRPVQRTVECMDEDCRGRPADERVMKCGGRASFEAHCGKNPKQQHWRNNFKVDIEGTATLAQ